MLKAELKKTYQYLSKFYFFTHDFFQSQDFLLIKTPQLVVCPGTEPSLEVFATNLKLESKSQSLFLATSPEIHLKKALSMGFQNIYEITTSFRNGEITDRHQPEFQILEWYRSGADLEQIKIDLSQLIHFLADQLISLKFDESRSIKKPQSIYSIQIAELFLQHLEFNLRPDTCFDELQNLCLKLNYRAHPSDTIDDLFFWLMTEHIEPKLNPNDLIFVENYPPFQAALATLNPQGWANRFEAYWQGYELCNAFQELTDIKMQRKRALEDLQKKKLLNKTPIPLDEDFFVALETMPARAAGVAVGLERVFMCLYGLNSISACTLFPHKIESLQKK